MRDTERFERNSPAMFCRECGLKRQLPCHAVRLVGLIVHMSDRRCSGSEARCRIFPLLLAIHQAAKDKLRSSVQRGFQTSVLRFIEDNWNLNQLTQRDRDATPLLSAFDFAQTPRAADPLPERTDCVGEPFPSAEPQRYAN